MLSVVQGLPPVLLALSLVLDPPVEPSQLEARILEVPESLHQSEPLVQEVPAWVVVAASPLPAGYRIASDFGYRPSRRNGRRRFHAGLDFHAERGTPVYAVRRGVVETIASNRSRRYFNGYGNAIVLHHTEDERWSFYAHLDEVLVEPGQLVEPGTLIGRVGNTTNRRFRGMGTHLHFEVRAAQPDGSPPFPGPYRRDNVDPEAWLADIGLRLERGRVPADVALGEEPVLVFGESTRL